MNFNEIQKQVSVLVSDEKASVSDFLNIEKKIEGAKEIPDYIRKPRLAFLSNFTIQGLPETIRARGVFHNLLLEIYNGPYNQYAQEILNKESELYKFGPDVIYLFIDLKTLPDVKEFIDLIKYITIHSAAKIVVFNKEIKAAYPKSTLILPFGFPEEDYDFPKWLEDSGHIKNWNTKYKELGDLRLAPDAFPDLAEELLKFAVSVIYATKKCVVTDLDNTLWKGILGEDGIENIKPNTELQKYLLELFDGGTILAINSRNNEDETLEAIEKQALKKDNFAAWQINWGDKAQNMINLAKDLNLGIDSFVFLDDDNFQQNLIREAFPQVAVIPFSDWRKGLKMLKSYAGFSKFQFTKEDSRKGQMYVEERKRKELQSSLKSLDDFLKELNLEMIPEEIKDIEDPTITRAAQLTQKTNQFNLRPDHRYPDLALQEFIKKGNRIWTISAKDRFGDHGIIGVLMIEVIENEWKVHNFLLSCRVLGKGVEDKVIRKVLLANAEKEKIKRIVAKYSRSSKNGQVSEFWNKYFGAPINEQNGTKIYNLDLHDQSK